MEHPIDLIRQAAARALPLRRPARRRGAQRRAAFSLGEWRLMVLGGLALGLAATGVDWPALRPDAPGGAAGVRRRFGFCHTGGGTNCVVDGDTFWIDGAKVRIADIDTAETHPSRCAEEARLDAAATERLQQLLSAGPVTLAAGSRDEDR